MGAERTTKFFPYHWLCWKLLGINFIGVHYKIHQAIFALVNNICVSVLLPLQFVLTIFLMDQTPADLYKYLTTCATNLSSCLKILIFSIKMQKMYETESILSELEQRVEINEDIQYYNELQQKVRRITNVYKGIYIAIGLSLLMDWLLSGERRLLFQRVWLPFNWEESAFKYWLTCTLQLTGVVGQVFAYIAVDSFPALALLWLSSHIELLARRISRIGWQVQESNEELQRLLDDQELQKCVEDQLKLYKLFDTIQNIISPVMFVQLTVTAFVICNLVIVVMYFAQTPSEFIFYLFYMLGNPIQIFPCCYYGTKMEKQFHDLSYSVFCCNWTHQGRKFKRHMLLFTERSLRQTKANAAFILSINLDTLIATYKGASSLFAVVLRMRN